MKEAYDEYLRVAEETLKVKYLTPDDRKLIVRGIWHVKTGHDLIKSEVPADLRRAASLLMIGGALRCER